MLMTKEQIVLIIEMLNTFAARNEEEFLYLLINQSQYESEVHEIESLLGSLVEGKVRDVPVYREFALKIFKAGLDLTLTPKQIVNCYLPDVEDHVELAEHHLEIENIVLPTGVTPDYEETGKALIKEGLYMYCEDFFFKAPIEE